MFVSWYKHNDINIAQLQFITAISLGLMNKSSNYAAASKQVRLLTLDSELQTLLKNQLKNEKSDLVSAYVHFLCKARLFRKSTGNMGRVLMVTLHDLVPSLSEKELCRIISRNIANTDPEYFILLYMQTQEWQNIFIRKMRSRIDDMDIINRESSAFYEYVRRCSATSYNIESKTPDNYLQFVFTNYFVKTVEYADIFKFQSNLKEVGSEDKRSKVDFYQIDDPINEKIPESIDFIKIASKINKSSYYLFSHNKSAIAYYDIFSWYRHSLSLKNYKTYRQKFNDVFAGLGVTLESQAFNDAQKIKYNKRIQLCKEYAALITNGIDTKDYYNFYIKVVSCSINCITHFANGGSAKDGTAYYERGGFNTSTGRDQDKFRADVEGFLAMRELIEWVNSPNNTTGVSIFTLPADIFRDKRYLKRFSSFREYVTLYEDTAHLMLEADDPERSSTYDSQTALLSNDALFDLIAKKATANSVIGISSSLMDKILSTSLVLGQKALVRGQIGNKEVLQQNLQSHIKYAISSGAFMQGRDVWRQHADVIVKKYKSLNMEFLDTTEFRIIAVMRIYNQQMLRNSKALKTLQSNKPDDYDTQQVTRLQNSNRNLAIIIFLLVEELAIAENIQLSCNNNYNLQAGESFIEYNKQIADCLIYAGSQIFSDFELDTINLRNALVVANTVYKIQLEMSLVNECINEELNRFNYSTATTADNNMFLVYAKVASQFQWLEVSYPIKDMLELEKFLTNINYHITDMKINQQLNSYNSSSLQAVKDQPVHMYYLQPKDLEPYCNDVCYVEYKAMSKKVLSGINYMLTGLEDLFSYYHDLWCEITENLTVCGSKETLTAEEKQHLREASRTIVMFKSTTKFYEDIKNIFKFEDHYAKRGSEFFLYTPILTDNQVASNLYTKVFIHDYGYIVTLRYFCGELQYPDIQEINESILHSLRLQLGIK